MMASARAGCIFDHLCKSSWRQALRTRQYVVHQSDLDFECVCTCCVTVRLCFFFNAYCYFALAFLPCFAPCSGFISCLASSFLHRFIFLVLPVLLVLLPCFYGLSSLLTFPASVACLAYLVCSPVCLSVWLPASLSVGLSVRLVYPSVCLFVGWVWADLASLCFC